MNMRSHREGNITVQAPDCHFLQLYAKPSFCRDIDVAVASHICWYRADTTLSVPMISKLMLDTVASYTRPGFETRQLDWMRRWAIVLSPEPVGQLPLTVPTNFGSQKFTRDTSTTTSLPPHPPCRHSLQYTQRTPGNTMKRRYLTVTQRLRICATTDARSTTQMMAEEFGATCQGINAIHRNRAPAARNKMSLKTYLLSQ
jgi:hypothetical protein